jgi:DNA primase
VAGRIHPDDVRALRERADLASVAGDYTTLRRSGATLKGLCPFHDEKTPSFHVDAAKGMWHCLAGETGVLTWEGTFPIAKLAGATQWLLTTRGAWVEAAVHSFGVQPLWAVRLQRNERHKTLYATHGHRWLVQSGPQRSSTRVQTTAELDPGDRLAWCLPSARLGDTRPLALAVAHGFTYGNGVPTPDGCTVDVSGPNPRELLAYFPKATTQEPGRMRVGRLPRLFAQRPSLQQPPAYLYGWLAGYFAAAGWVATDGRASLASTNEADIDFVDTVATRLGIATYGLEQQRRGVTAGDSPLFATAFMSSTLAGQFFVRSHHRQRFEQPQAGGRTEQPDWVVCDVAPSDRVEEVYCAVVPGTHAFVLADHLLTGNCFGCSAGGDVYGLLQQAEALSFAEAVEHLARREGVTLRYEQLSPGQRRALGRRTRLTEATQAAAAWFCERLADADADAARDYLAARGIDEATQARFEIGWAPDRWDGLVRALRDQGFADQELVDAGVASQGRYGPIDRFRGRIVFPIHERSGRAPIAFGGRLVPGMALATAGRDGDPPKYINSPESEIYKKGDTLYGLAQARAEIQRRQAALVVEGYTDVIAMHLVGLEHAVATCGTALTADHFRQLERYGRRVVLALDADDAGYRAAERARALAAEVGVREVAVLPLPVGTDPAELAAAGREAVDAAFAEVRTATEFQLEHLLRTADTDTPEAQAEAYRATFPLLARLSDRSLRYRYIRDVVAPAVRLSADRIERELDEALATGRVDTRDPEATRAAPPSDTATVRRLSGPRGEPADPQLRLERQVLQVALQRPHQLPEAWQEVTGGDFTSEVSRRLWQALADTGTGDLEAVLAALPTDDDRARVRALALSPSPVPDDTAHVVDLIRRLQAASCEREIEAVQQEMRALNTDVDAARVHQLLARQYELERRRRALADRQGA